MKLRHYSDYRRGEITIFLTMLLSVMCMFVMALKDAAEHEYVCMRIEIAMDSALLSCMSEYNKSIFDRFGILLLDPSYRSDESDIANTEEHFRTYLSENLKGEGSGVSKSGIKVKDVTIEKTITAIDNNVNDIRRQIKKYAESYLEDGFGVNKKAASEIAGLKGDSHLADKMDNSISVIEAGYGSIPAYIRDIRNEAEYAGRHLAELSGCDSEEVIIDDMPDIGLTYIGEQFAGWDDNGNIPMNEDDRDTWIGYLTDVLGCIADEGDKAKGELEYILFGMEYENDNSAKMCETLMNIFINSYLREVSVSGSIEDEAEDYARWYIEEHYYESYEGESFTALKDLYICSKAYEFAYNKCSSLLRGNYENYSDDSDAMSYREYMACLLMDVETDIMFARLLNVIGSHAILSGNPGLRIDRCITGMRVSAGLEYGGREYEIEREYSYH